MSSPVRKLSKKLDEEEYYREIVRRDLSRKGRIGRKIKQSLVKLGWRFLHSAGFHIPIERVKVVTVDGVIYRIFQCKTCGEKFSDQNWSWEGTKLGIGISIIVVLTIMDLLFMISPLKFYFLFPCLLYVIIEIIHIFHLVKYS